MNPESSNSYDGLDEFSPPRFIDYVEFNFNHPEYFYHSFGRDVVTTADEHVWEFDVETNQSGTTTLSWDKPTVNNTDIQLFMYDVTRQVPIDMSSVTSYTFEPSKGNRFKVYYGRDVLRNIKPDKALLGAAFPNPANSLTTIPFSLPERNRTLAVRLEVFDIMGKKVATLLQKDLAAGFYKSDWDASEATSANGIYIYRLTVESEILTGKVVLKK